MLRLDWNILFNMINILILYVLMKKFLFKPINNILEKRQAEADAQLQNAKKAEELAVKSKEDYEASIKDANEEGAAILSKAREEATAEYSRIIEEANKKAGSILEKAAGEAEAEKAKILRSAENDVRELVVNAVAHVTGQKEDAAGDLALYDEFLRQNAAENKGE